jgi:hypothetical protein
MRGTEDVDASTATSTRSVDPHATLLTSLRPPLPLRLCPRLDCSSTPSTAGRIDCDAEIDTEPTGKDGDNERAGGCGCGCGCGCGTVDATEGITTAAAIDSGSVCVDCVTPCTGAVRRGGSGGGGGGNGGMEPTMELRLRRWPGRETAALRDGDSAEGTPLAALSSWRKVKGCGTAATEGLIAPGRC